MAGVTHCIIWSGYAPSPFDKDDLTREQLRRLKKKVAEVLGIDAVQLSADFKIDDLKSLGIDSLDVVELVMELEEEFDLE